MNFRGLSGIKAKKQRALPIISLHGPLKMAVEMPNCMFRFVFVIKTVRFYLNRFHLTDEFAGFQTQSVTSHLSSVGRAFDS